MNDPDSVILEMNRIDYDGYIQQGVIADGMIPKLDNSFKAIDHGVSEVIILHAKNLLQGKGTVLH